MSCILKRLPIRFEVINTEEQKYRLAGFAASFEHYPDMTDDHPIIVVKRGEKWIGFFQFCNLPFLQGAWHTNPDIASKRDVIEAARAIIAWAKGQGGCLTGSPVGDKHFTPDLMERLGMVRTGIEVYKVL